MANPIVQQKYSIHSQVNRASLVEAKSVPFVFLLLLFASSRFNLLLNETERRRETKLQSPEMGAKKQPPAAAKLVSKTGWHTWHQIRSIHHTISIPSCQFNLGPIFKNHSPASILVQTTIEAYQFWNGDSKMVQILDRKINFGH